MRATPWCGSHVGKLHFVMNSRAGSQDDAAVQQVITTVLGAAGRNFALHLVADPSALAATAAKAVLLASQADEGGQGEPTGVVVAVGGDGTLNTVATAVLGSGLAFGLLPRGTFNYMARAHGIPLEPAAALELILHGRPQPVQVGLLNQRPFFVNASLGLYPQLLQDREAFKQRFGRTRLVALWAALNSMLRAHPRLTLRIAADGQPARELQVSTLFIGNNALQLDDLGMPEAEGAGSNGLAALALRAFRPGELLWLGLRGALGRLGDAQDLTHFMFHELTVEPKRARRSLKVALDGEVSWLRPPLVFAVDPRPLWLIRAEGAGPSAVPAA